MNKMIACKMCGLVQQLGALNNNSTDVNIHILVKNKFAPLVRTNSVF